MRKNKEIKFIEIDDRLINIDKITYMYRAEDEKTFIATVDGGHYYSESFESIKKRLKEFILKE